MGSSVQSPEPGPCQNQTANTWMDVQFSTKQKSMAALAEFIQTCWIVVIRV